MCAERKTLGVPQRTYAVPNFEFSVPYLLRLPTWLFGNGLVKKVKVLYNVDALMTVLYAFISCHNTPSTWRT